MEVHGLEVVETESGWKCIGGSRSIWNVIEVDGSRSSKINIDRCRLPSHVIRGYKMMYLEGYGR